MKKYCKRLIESKIESKLKSSGAVLVAGPKFCGKTTTCILCQACRALNISPEDLMGDLKSFGLFFKDFAVRDLSIYASTLDG